MNIFVPRYRSHITKIFRILNKKPVLSSKQQVACYSIGISSTRLQSKLLNINNKNTSRLSVLILRNIGTMPPVDKKSIPDYVETLIKSNKVLIFTTTTCPYCTKVKELFHSINQEYTAIVLDEVENGGEIRDYLFERTRQKTVPNVFVNGRHVGGCDSTTKAHQDGRLAKWLSSEVQEPEVKYDYDLLVIGGGSGGLACSKMAANYGAKVAILDFIVPTPKGTTWGLGGTCVNVGCIPKKLMHQSALLGENLHDSTYFGWKTPEQVNHDWNVMRDAIQNHIGSLNWGYRVQLRDKKVEYINGFGKFLDPHKLLVTKKNGKTQEISADKIVIAVGGRPKYPEIPGAREYGITSDDLFSLTYNPGKTVCVGASYVSLECAGFLHGIGLDVTVMVRSILLRGFDQQMANKIGEHMEGNGIKFIREAVPTEIIQIKDGTPGEYKVIYKLTNGEVKEEFYNTVLFAIGRDVCTTNMGIENAGVKLSSKTGKVLTTFEQSNVDNIYAIGDVIEESSAHGRLLELTPVATRSGQLLAQRLFGDSDVKMDYYAVPTTVFTPLEYGSIGLSEEEAIQTFGDENIEVYHSNFWPLEWTVPKRPESACYAKLICNLNDNERVVGFHVAGPNAGEITQGYAVAMKLGATKRDFDMTVGIHPTCSEVFTTLFISKRSGKDISVAGC